LARSFPGADEHLRFSNAGIYAKLAPSRINMRYFQISLLILLMAAGSCALPTRRPGIHHPSSNSSASKFDPNGAALWAKVCVDRADFLWNYNAMLQSFFRISLSFVPGLLERMLGL
jgi:hypothetical protein